MWKSLFDKVPLADLNNLIAAEMGQAAGQPVANAGVTNTAVAGQAKSNAWVNTHLLPHWYGQDPRSNKWYCNSTGGRGWWSAWTGRPMWVMRVALRRALQVSLGDRRKDSACRRGDLNGLVVGDVSRNWPIELWWNCPVGNFQASVAWRRHPPDPALPDSGVVSVTWMTPGVVFEELSDEPGPLRRQLPPLPLGCQCKELRSDLRVVCGCAPPKTDSVLRPVLEAPPGLAGVHPKRRGSWIVGQTITEPPIAPVNTAANNLGQGFTAPNGVVTSWGPVLTVEPSSPDGGVRETGQWGKY